MDRSTKNKTPLWRNLRGQILKRSVPFQSAAQGLAGLVGATAIRLWMKTLDYKAAYYDPSVDPIHPDCNTPGIYVFWHENILFPVYLRGHNHLTMLLSQHRDANLLSKAAYHLGFEVVRGSTYRGSISAVRTLLRSDRQHHLTITPDGPRGPRRRFAQGPVYLASKLNIPLILLGIGFDRPWRLGSWDKFAIPRPFSRARVVVSPRIHLPPNLDRKELEIRRDQIEKLLTRLTDEATAWAESGTRKIEQHPIRRQASSRLQSHSTPEKPARAVTQPAMLSEISPKQNSDIQRRVA